MFYAYVYMCKRGDVGEPLQPATPPTDGMYVYNNDIYHYVYGVNDLCICMWIYVNMCT